MKPIDHDMLLHNANPVPDPSRLEDELFSIDDVAQLLDDSWMEAVEPHRDSRRIQALTLTAAFTAVMIAVGLVALVLRAEPSPRVGTPPEDDVIVLRDTGYGSAAYNPFVGIHPSIVSSSAEPVFVAAWDGPTTTTNSYFRLVSLDSFNGQHFYAQAPIVSGIESGALAQNRDRWLGPAETATVTVKNDRLRMDWLPAPATPIALPSFDAIRGEVVVRTLDNSLRLVDELTSSGTAYTVISEISTVDVAAVIGDSTGELTRIFRSASDAGESVPTPQPTTTRRESPYGADGALSVINVNRASEIAALADRVAGGGGSNLEKGLLLEAWFHSDVFAYSTMYAMVDNGTDVATWLLDTESPNYHLGYVEQYTTAMAVMARTLSIPSRVVVGFAAAAPTGDDPLVVRDQNAHAWVELWIEEQGWLRFDPTPRSDGVAQPTYATLSDQLGFDLLPYLTP